MSILELLNDKTLKAKQKTEMLSQWFIDNPKKVDTVIAFVRLAKDPIKATCIEGMEFATKNKPEIASLAWLEFVSEALTEKTPRVKWESAKVIGNIAHLHPAKLDAAIMNLLTNTEHAGTVVRWSAAFALGQIVQLKSKHTKALISAIESICMREENNSIKKIYTGALQKVNV